MDGPGAFVVPAGFNEMADIVSLSGKMESHGSSQTSPSAVGTMNVMGTLNPSFSLRSASTNNGAITDPSCAPALKIPPAVERLAPGKSPAIALMPAV